MTPSVEEEGVQCLQQIWDQHLTKIPPPTGRESYEPRPSDVIINALVKSGSTLLCQLVYQVVVHSGGATATDPTGENFEDQMEVTPWIEFTPYFPKYNGETTPRVFKSHAPLASFQPLKCRHILLIRDPTSLPSSFLDFLFDAIVKDPESKSDAVREATFHAFAEQTFDQPVDSTNFLPPNWHAFARDAVSDEPRDDVLVLFYENVVKDIAGTVRMVAKFIGCDLKEEGVGKVVERCSREYMLQKPMFEGMYESTLFQLPRKVYKVKPERESGFRRFKVKAELLSEIEKHNVEVFGVRSYGDIVTKISQKQIAGRGE